MLEIVAWLAYAVPVLVLFLLPGRKPKTAGPPPTPDTNPAPAPQS